MVKHFSYHISVTLHHNTLSGALNVIRKIFVEKLIQKGKKINKSFSLYLFICVTGHVC